MKKPQKTPKKYYCEKCESYIEPILEQNFKKESRSRRRSNRRGRDNRKSDKERKRTRDRRPESLV